jgi:large subunit ribosomal protein L25
VVSERLLERCEHYNRGTLIEETWVTDKTLTLDLSISRFTPVHSLWPFFLVAVYCIPYHPDGDHDWNPLKTMPAVHKYAKLAQALPPRLLTFLARYPPPAILPKGADPETVKTGYQQDSPNPFMPTKHPITGKWHNPVYSLRRQADLVKMAREHGVEELLPQTSKGTDDRIRKRVELGLRVKGTGVGQQVKGHKHERTMVAKYVRTLFTAAVAHAVGNVLTTIV